LNSSIFSGVTITVTTGTLVIHRKTAAIFFFPPPPGFGVLRRQERRDQRRHSPGDRGNCYRLISMDHPLSALAGSTFKEGGRGFCRDAGGAYEDSSLKHISFLHGLRAL